MREDGDVALSDGWAQLNICWKSLSFDEGEGDGGKMFCVAMRNMLTAQTTFMYTFNKTRTNKQLVEATLRSCPGIKLRVLVRQTNGKTVSAGAGLGRYPVGDWFRMNNS